MAPPDGHHQIRATFLRVLSADGHARITRSPLVLRDDPTTLFTGSGIDPDWRGRYNALAEARGSAPGPTAGDGRSG